MGDRRFRKCPLLFASKVLPEQPRQSRLRNAIAASFFHDVEARPSVRTRIGPREHTILRILNFINAHAGVRSCAKLLDMFRSSAIHVLLFGAIFSTLPVMASPISYTMGFTLQNGIAPTAGSFIYDPATGTFSSFTVTWDGDVWNLTSSANNPTISSPGPPCIGGLTGGAASFAMLSGGCFLGVPGVSNSWLAGPPPQGQTTEKFNFQTTGSSTTSIAVFSGQNPEIPVDKGAGQWFLASETISGFQGGTTAAPTFLIGAAPVDEITGTISGQGSEDYYGFDWAGGAFSATASISGASAGASYVFSGGVIGSCNAISQTLNSGDSFTGTLSVADLPAGQYCIGLDAIGGGDPNFALSFNTPVSVAST